MCSVFGGNGASLDFKCDSWEMMSKFDFFQDQYVLKENHRPDFTVK
jgi:hypothetical protein